MKHTPGPWTVDFAKPNANSPCRILGDGEVARVTYRGKLTGDSWKANAQLIAAAPELLEALKDVIRYHREHDSGEGELFGLDFVTECIAAVAKAEGR